jgi:flagellar motor switch protein FliN/FliY
MHKLDQKDAEAAAHAKTDKDAEHTPMTPQDTLDTAEALATESAVFPYLDTSDAENALTAPPEEGGAGMNAMLNVRLDVQVVLAPAGADPRLYRRTEPQDRRTRRPYGQWPAGGAR